LTYEFLEVLGGEDSKKFKKFRKLLRKGFMALQDHADKIIALVEMMLMGQRDLPCFELREETLRIMKTNLFPQVDGSVAN
jgi:phosphatidylinositol 4-kinase